MVSRFFVSCQPRLESDLIYEIESFWHLLIDLDGMPTRSRPVIVYEDTGGVEIECENHLGFQINLFSKMANRVLWRICNFEARYYDQFEKELKKIDIKKYLSDQKYNLFTDSSKSRLFHEGNLEEAARRALPNASLKHDEDLLSVYLRIFKDRVTVSLDTSGRHLHKRGYRAHQGEAPIRETLAAKVYNFLLKSVESEHIKYSPHCTQTTLLDPFCGAGTLIFEAASYYQPNLVTQFDFERFCHLPSLFKSASWKKNFKIENSQKNNFVGIEIDSKTFSKLEANRILFNSMFPAVKNDIKLLNFDSKDVDLKFLEHNSVVVLANPPYGERLVNTDAELVLASLERITSLQGIVVVHPPNWRFNFSRLKSKQSESFNNQGLDLRISLFAL